MHPYHQALLLNAIFYNIIQQQQRQLQQQQPPIINIYNITNQHQPPSTLATNTPTNETSNHQPPTTAATNTPTNETSNHQPPTTAATNNPPTNQPSNQATINRPTLLQPLLTISRPIPASTSRRPPSRRPPSTNIFIIGDSHARRTLQSWENQPHPRNTTVTITGNAQGGLKTEQLLQLIRNTPTDYIKKDTTHLIIFIGTNDIINGKRTTTDIYADIIKIIQLLIPHGHSKTRFIITPPIPTPEQNFPFNFTVNAPLTTIFRFPRPFEFADYLPLTGPQLARKYRKFEPQSYKMITTRDIHLQPSSYLEIIIRPILNHIETY